MQGPDVAQMENNVTRAKPLNDLASCNFTDPQHYPGLGY